eukprot:TRINITY_DN1788_c1_g1_i2.p1 TRINITY_DN1788_c1_g1~~TRINITY_DN1788_c1_g1_i2.p1  ORF type:complete len:430 (+),score=105.79 TRINITY_DN1788_c1_g1_i2:1574-2863(+)
MKSMTDTSYSLDSYLKEKLELEEAISPSSSFQSFPTHDFGRVVGYNDDYTNEGIKNNNNNGVKDDLEGNGENTFEETRKFILSHVVIDDYEPELKVMSITLDASSMQNIPTFLEEGLEMERFNSVLNWVMFCKKNKNVLSMTIHQQKRAPDKNDEALYNQTPVSSPLKKDDLNNNSPYQHGKCRQCSEPLSTSFFRIYVGRFCNYTGHFYCSNCHTNKKSIIPAKVVKEWDHNKYPVCDRAYEHIQTNERHPIINLFVECKAIYTQVTELDNAQKLRAQAVVLAEFLRTCKSSSKLFHPVRNCLHLIDSIHVYSLFDLQKIKAGKLVPKLYKYIKACMHHVTTVCKTCQGKAYYCELCNSDELIFPFQFDKIKKCNYCGCVFHFKCADLANINVISPNGDNHCPKCERIRKMQEKLKEHENFLKNYSDD